MLTAYTLQLILMPARLVLYEGLIFDICFHWREKFPAVILQINEAIDMCGQKNIERDVSASATCKTLDYIDCKFLIKNLEIDIFCELRYGEQ